MQQLAFAIHELLKVQKRVNASFSGISQHRLLRLMSARGLKQGQASLPDSVTRHSHVVKPHKWTHKREVDESSALLIHLRREVYGPGHGLGSVSNVLMDVQSLNASNPMKMTVADRSGELTVMGVPDVVILGDGLDDSVIDPFSDAYAVLDWKTQERASKSDFQIMMQAIVLAGEGGCGSPAFVTDFRQGFRCWIVVNDILFHFHPPDTKEGPGWLALADGVALIRYFIKHHGRMAPEDLDALMGHRGDARGDDGGAGGASGAHRGFSSGGGHPDSAAGAGTGPSKASAAGENLHMGPSGSSVGTEARPGECAGPRDVASYARISTSESSVAVENCGGPEALVHSLSAAHASPSDVDGPAATSDECDGAEASSRGAGDSPTRQPLSKAEVAAYQAVALEEFAMQTHAVREILGMHWHAGHFPN